MSIVYKIAEPFLKRNAKLLSASYSTVAKDYGNKNIERHLRITNEIKSLVISHPNDILLDLGCGNGDLVHSLNNQIGEIKTICGLDISYDMLKVASLKNKKTFFVNGTASKLPIKDNSINLIVSSLCFHHLPNQKKALMEIHRILKHEGMFICCTAGEQYLSEIVAHIIDLALYPKWTRYFLTQPTMFWPISKKNMQKQLEMSGFKVAEIYDQFWTDTYKSSKEVLKVFNNITGQFITSTMPHDDREKYNNQLLHRLEKHQITKLTDHLIFSKSIKKR